MSNFSRRRFLGTAVASGGIDPDKDVDLLAVPLAVNSSSRIKSYSCCDIWLYRTL